MRFFHDFLAFFFAPLCLALDDGSGGGGGSGTPPPAGGAGTPPPAGGTPPPSGGTPPPAGGTPPPAPGVANSSAPILNDKGEFAKGWADKFGAPSLAKFTTLEGMAKSYASLEKMLGSQNKVAVPGADASPEERAAFYEKLGRPAKPEDYGVKMPEKIGDKPFPKELWDDGRAKGFTAKAHELGLTPAQVQGLVEFDLSQGLSVHETNAAASQKAVAAATEALKAEWGANYPKQLELAKKAAEQAGGADLLAHPLANDPVFIKAMAKVGAMIVEEPAAGARGTSHAPTDPKSEIAKIRGDKSHPYHIKGHPQHAEAVKRMSALYAQAHPEPARS